MTPLAVFAVCWIGFALSWLVAAFWSSPAVARLSSGTAWLYRGLFVLGFVLLNHRAAAAVHAPRLWHVGWTGGYVLALLTLPGFAFAWWARLHLGRLWSSGVTRKAEHHVVETGPYGIVRHPIYTGITFACLVSAIAGANWVAILGFAVVVLGIWVKARAEEVFLGAELAPGAYAAYRRRVPMLVPFARGW